MTKEGQPTTHNAERGARVTCRERLETGSSPKRKEKKIGCLLIGEISWRFTTNCSAVWRKHMARHVGDFIRDVFGERLFGDFWRKLSRCLGENVRRFWREPFRDFGDLENFIR